MPTTSTPAQSRCVNRAHRKLSQELGVPHHVAGEIHQLIKDQTREGPPNAEELERWKTLGMEHARQRFGGDADRLLEAAKRSIPEHIKKVLNETGLGNHPIVILRLLVEFWFGPYAIKLDPTDDLFVSSKDFTQRYLTVAAGPIGLDSSGYLGTGGMWRQTVIFGSGAIYRDATPEDAKIFDEIMNRVCFVPYPTK